MKTIMLAAGFMLTAGCVSTQNDLDETFGVATKTNMNAQIVDATPAQGAPEGDGGAADLATLRYKTDKVKVGAAGEFEAGEDAEAGGN